MQIQWCEEAAPNCAEAVPQSATRDWMSRKLRIVKGVVKGVRNQRRVPSARHFPLPMLVRKGTRALALAASVRYHAPLRPAQWDSDSKVYVGVRPALWDVPRRKSVSKRQAVVAWKGQQQAPWNAMRTRIENPNCGAYHNYGGRGITICKRWTLPWGEGFKNFLADMGPRPGSHARPYRNTGALRLIRSHGQNPPAPLGALAHR
jgi:hypothetical protein